MADEGALQSGDARAVLCLHLRRLDIVHGGRELGVVGHSPGLQQIARYTVEAGEDAGANGCESKHRQAVTLAERIDQMVDGDARNCVHGPHALEDEQTLALCFGRQRQQPRVPQQDLLDQSGRLETVCNAKRAALDPVGARLEPHQCQAIVQKRQWLQAVAFEFGDGVGVAGRVNQDCQVVR